MCKDNILGLRHRMLVELYCFQLIHLSVHQVHPSVLFCGHSNLVIYQPVSSKLHKKIFFIKLSTKCEIQYGFVWWVITKMATKMAAACLFALLDSLSHFSPNSFQVSYMDYFHQTLASWNMCFVWWKITKIATACRHS